MRSVGAKLFILVLGVLLITLGALGVMNARLHRRHLEAARRASAERIGEIIRRSTSHYMLRNDRTALRHIVETIGEQPGIARLRIVDANGREAFATPATADPHVLRTITPILNTPSCATAACHAHPASQKTLGVLELDLSLADTDAAIASASRQFIAYTGGAIVLTLLATGMFVWRFVHKPVRVLREGTKRLGGGELGVQIPVTSRDELGALARAFNAMSRELDEARQRQMIHAEKLTSLGKLAAVVAHEINNPLSGILTYAKLMRKWIERGDELSPHRDDMRDSLQLIENESRRCGGIVRNLLAFAREQPLNVTEVDIHDVLQQTLSLVKHKLELGNIKCELGFSKQSLGIPKSSLGIPKCRGDAAQLEQLFLALIMNAIEAMPNEGLLRIDTSTDDGNVVVTIADDGTGIPPEILPRLFEPFTTTKEIGGVGLGLAISKGIVDRHHGTIRVQSEPGRGTTFTITLPAVAAQEEAA